MSKVGLIDAMVVSQGKFKYNIFGQKILTGYYGHLWIAIIIHEWKEYRCTTSIP